MSLGIWIMDFVLLDESFLSLFYGTFMTWLKLSSLCEGDSGLTLALISYKKLYVSE
jgi:hypothetical protein